MGVNRLHGYVNDKDVGPAKSLTDQECGHLSDLLLKFYEEQDDEPVRLAIAKVRAHLAARSDR